MNDECTACGSTPLDRAKYKANNGADSTIPLDLLTCPHCGCTKCCMCDMGNDVRCLTCEGDED